MAAWTRTLLLGSLIVTAFAGRAAAQAPGELPAAPVPLSPAPPPPPPMLGRPVPLAPAPAPALPGLTPPGSPGLTPQGAPGPLTYAPPNPADPGPDGWGPYGPPSSLSALFFDAEITFLKPTLKNTITNGPLLANGARLPVPSVGLDTTVSPLFELGYRLPDCCGQFSLAYRFFSAAGNGAGSINGVLTPIRTRADLQVLDFDYGSTPVEVAPRWDFSWRIGARLADVFFDSRAAADGNLIQASSSYLAGGAHARAELERRIVPVPGLALFGRLDGALLVGQSRQHFREVVTAADGTVFAFASAARKTQTVPMLNLQLGLSYVPPILPNLKFTTGYQFEQIWYLGQLGLDNLGNQMSSRGELWSHGWFVRGQVDF